MRVGGVDQRVLDQDVRFVPETGHCWQSTELERKRTRLLVLNRYSEPKALDRDPGLRGEAEYAKEAVKVGHGVEFASSPAKCILRRA